MFEVLDCVEGDGASDPRVGEPLCEDVTGIAEYEERFAQEQEAKRLKKTTANSVFTIYCDGSNWKGRGGYGVVLCENNRVIREISKTIEDEHVTNNVAELHAVHAALQLVRPHYRNVILTDSMYAINAVTVWYDSWRVSNWLTTSGEKVANQGLIHKIRKTYEARQDWVRLTHVKGHNGDPCNHLADHLAGMWKFKHSPVQSGAGNLGGTGTSSRTAVHSNSEDAIRKLLHHHQRGTIGADILVDKLRRLLKEK